MAVETSKHFTLNDATHVTNTHVHYSIKVSKKNGVLCRYQTLWLTYLPRAIGGSRAA